MKFKPVATAIGLVVSLAVSAQVVHALKFSNFSVGQSVVAYDELPANGEIFANWTSRFQRWTLNFGVNNASTYDFVGFRVDAPSSQKANNWSMDVNTTAGSSPYFLTYAIEPGNNLPVYADGTSANSPSSNYTVTNLTNGYQRVRFNASSVLPANSSFSSIYFADDVSPGQSCSDSVTNATVNGLPVAANIQHSPTYDCAIAF